MLAKGKLKDRGPDFSGMLYIEGQIESFCTVFPTHCQTAKEIRKRKENTAELRRRWNAFEEGGLVEELVGACERARERLLGMGQKDHHRTVGILNQVLAKAKGSS